jgi:hypothetical protein
MSFASRYSTAVSFDWVEGRQVLYVAKLLRSRRGVVKWRVVSRIRAP